MGNAVIVDYVRTPYGRNRGSLSGMHPVELFGAVLKGLVDRNGLGDGGEVEQVIGGCVTQVAQQTASVTRNAWLHMGLNYSAGCSTIDNQCGSAQQATGLLASQINSGVIKVAMSGGVESMSQVPLGTGRELGRPRPDSWNVDLPDQFTAADRIAGRRGITREELDHLGLISQQRAAAAWENGFYTNGQVLPITLNEPFQAKNKDGSPKGDPVTEVTKDEGLRATTAEGLAKLRAVLEGGLHGAGNSSQISDGATAMLLMDEDLAKAKGLKPRARIVAQNIVGSEPHYHLDGPVESTAKLLKDSGMSLADMDIIEINEAFASVVLSAVKVHGMDLDKVNVNGGAIAIGHPVGSTGVRLLGQAMNELERRDGEFALVTMCCGGALATGTIIQRIG